MEDTEKMTITLYRLNEESFNYREFDKRVEWVMDSDRNQNDLLISFNEQKVKSIDGIDFRLFYSHKKRKPTWRDFLSGVVVQPSEITEAMNVDASFIAFIGYKDNVFAISGGQGNFIIHPYVDQNFGLEVICRILPQNHNAIKSIQDIGVFGSVLGSEKFFRGDYKLNNEEQFGKIYKSIISGIDKEIVIQELGFDQDELKRTPRVLAKSYFQVSKSISFDRLIELIKQISLILDRPPNFVLNKIIYINRQVNVNKQLIRELQSNLFEHLFSIFSGTEDGDINICNKDFSKYLTASAYQIRVNRGLICELDNLDNLNQLITNKDFIDELNLESIEDFEESIEKMTLVSLNEEGFQLTRDKLIKHFHGEITYKNSVYFFLDGDWYQIDDGFLDDLNSEMKNLIEDCLDDSILLEEFDPLIDEKIFNQKYLSNSEFIVLDRVIANEIELCDLLKVKGKELHLIHVKKGFNNSIRELVSQVEQSAYTLLSDMKSGFSHIKNLDKMLNSPDAPYLKIISSQIKPSKKLIKIFEKKRERDITFCLAFVDVAKSDRDITDITKFKSNIAKFSIIDLSRKIRGLGFNFKLIQLKRP